MKGYVKNVKHFLKTVFNIKIAFIAFDFNIRFFSHREKNILFAVSIHKQHLHKKKFALQAQIRF